MYINFIFYLFIDFEWVYIFLGVYYKIIIKLHKFLLDSSAYQDSFLVRAINKTRIYNPISGSCCCGTYSSLLRRQPNSAKKETLVNYSENHLIAQYSFIKLMRLRYDKTVRGESHGRFILIDSDRIFSGCELNGPNTLTRHPLQFFSFSRRSRNIIRKSTKHASSRLTMCNLMQREQTTTHKK